MKSCPKCTSIRLRPSHAQGIVEHLFRYSMGHRYQECPDCDWRGNRKRSRKAKPMKLGLAKRLGIYILAIVVVLFIVFFLVESLL